MELPSNDLHVDDIAELQTAAIVMGAETPDNIRLDPRRVIEILQRIWWIPEWGVEYKDGILKLHTGGWSDNEYIIRILCNTLFWAMYWEESRRGGHYKFDLTRVKDREEEINR